MNKNLIIALAAIVLLVIGGFVGYKIKKSTVIESQVIHRDTTFIEKPIVDVRKISYPVNIPYAVLGPSTVIYIHDTAFLDIPQPTFVSDDTLRYQKDGQNIFVAISDTGNCEGIIRRGSLFGGDLKERVITVNTTNTVVQPYPFVSLYAGAAASFSGRWKAFDVGPAVSVSFRQRHSIGYSYGLNTSTHNLTLQTKIK